MKYIITIIYILFLAVPSFAQLKLVPVQKRPFQTDLERAIAQMRNFPVISRDQKDPRLLHFAGDTYKATSLKEDFVDYKDPEMTAQQKLAHILFNQATPSKGSTRHLTLTKQQSYELDKDNWIFIGNDVGKARGLMTIQEWKEVFRDIYESAGYDLLTNDNRNPNDIMISYKQETEDGSIGYAAIRIFKKQDHVFAVLINKIQTYDDPENRKAIFHGLKQTPQDVFLAPFENEEDCQFGEDCY